MAQRRASDFPVAIASTVMKGEPPHLPPPATVTDDRNWDREGPSPQNPGSRRGKSAKATELRWALLALLLCNSQADGFLCRTPAICDTFTVTSCPNARNPTAGGLRLPCDPTGGAAGRGRTGRARPPSGRIRIPTQALPSMRSPASAEADQCAPRLCRGRRPAWRCVHFDGARKYLTTGERDVFLRAAEQADR